MLWEEIKIEISQGMVFIYAHTPSVCCLCELTVFVSEEPFVETDGDAGTK